MVITFALLIVIFNCAKICCRLTFLVVIEPTQIINKGVPCYKYHIINRIAVILL